MECLDANAVQDLMSDALEANARAVVMTHLDTCADCRELVGVLAKGTIRESSQAPGLEATALPATGLEATLAAATRDSDPALDATLDTDRAPKLPGISVGKTLGKYTLVERLGAGAMGVVYRAEDRDLSRSVAVKILHRPDGALTQRLVREAQAMAQVNHPNVVAVYDVGISDATTYIAMELVPGVSLRQWQETERTIPELIEAYVAAGRGLAAAHAAGIVHRDFKPDNVLVGNDGRVRVTDFGLAAARPTNEEPARRLSPSDLALTRSGTVLGTPAYMAPEQFEGGNVDARTDQFNFCVALYEALYKERPFGGKSFEELGGNVTAGIFTPAPANARVSKALRAIVVKGLSTKPGDRYAAMDHLLDELARDRAKPWRRAALASALLAVVLGMGFGVDFTVHDRLSEKSAQSFRSTAKQIDRTVQLIVKLNHAISGQVFLFEPMHEVSAFRDQADFDLGSAGEDERDLEHLHELLASADWKFAADLTPSNRPSVIAVGDTKGRLLYTTASADWKTDLTQLPWVREAMQTGLQNMHLVPYADPDFRATKLVGAAPDHGMAVMFTRTGKGGDSLFIQILDADEILQHIQLDDGTLLSIVAPRGQAYGNVPHELLSRAIGETEITLGTATYQVATRPIVGPDERLAGHVVMASRVDGVLSLFPNARAVFAVAMLVAAGAAIGLYLRARQLSSV